jgi:hypothetical protein
MRPTLLLLAEDANHNKNNFDRPACFHRGQQASQISSRRKN